MGAESCWPRRFGDVAPNFYPAAIGVWRSVMPSLAGMAAVRGAEPSVEQKQSRPVVSHFVFEPPQEANRMQSNIL
jgi:hypothetical protein